MLVNRTPATLARGAPPGNAATIATALAALALALATASPSALEAKQRRGEIVRVTAQVRDIDTNAGLEGAVIELSGVAARHVTVPSGRISFEVAVGEYTLTVRRAGYVTMQGGFEVIRPGEFDLLMHKEEADAGPGLPARLAVRVVDSMSGSVVEGADVSLTDGRRGVTGADGRVAFDDIAWALTRVTVSRMGYETRTEPVTLHPDRTTAVEVGMTVEAVELPPIKVEVRSRFLENRGYYRRLEQGIITRVLTRETIRQRGSTRISDAFARMPGLRIDRPSADRAVLRVRDCPLAIFVDGVEWDLDIEGSVNIDQLPPDWVEVAEIYWGPRTPPEFRGRYNGGCGSVVVWTGRAAAGN